MSDPIGGAANVTSTVSIEEVSSAINVDASNLEAAIANAGENPNDPTALIQMQQELAKYNIAMQTQSAVIKSIEDTAKSVTQRL